MKNVEGEIMRRYGKVLAGGLAMLAAAAVVAGEAKSCRLVFSGYEGTETLWGFPALQLRERRA